MAPVHRSTVVHKYLARYAEAEAHDSPVTTAADLGVAIPCCGEGPGILATLDTVPVGDAAVIVVVVVNEPQDASGTVRQRNVESLAALRERFPDGEAPFGHVWTIDRTGLACLPRKQGVGLARKIGGDALLGLWARAQLREEVFAWTDSDVQLPPDYLTSLLRLKACAAAAGHFPYVHRSLQLDDAPTEALAIAYEIYLRHYELGLVAAGSPYAYPTIGSTIASRFEAYAKVRGAPLRRAGEDFHLLNKLRKVGDIAFLGGGPIALSCRRSERVPFGTGAFIDRWRQTPPESIPLYHPRTFDGLRATLRAQARAAAGERFLDALSPEAKALGLPPSALEALSEDEGLVEGALGRGTTAVARERHLLGSFDGLRSLQLIHRLRDRCFPSLPLRDGLRSSEFVPAGLADASLETIRGELAALLEKAPFGGNAPDRPNSRQPEWMPEP